MAWAIYSGFKNISSRSEWLDREAQIIIIDKIIACIVIGYIVGAFCLIFLNYEVDWYI